MAKLTPTAKKTSSRKRVSKKVLSERAKKGWETRRRNEKKASKGKKKPAPKPSRKAALKVEPKVSSRSLASKKAWETRRAEQARQEEIRQRRSEASKKAWAERKRIQRIEKIGDLAVRQDLRPVLPEVFAAKKAETKQLGEKKKRILIQGEIARLSKYPRETIVQGLVDLGVLDKPVKLTKKEALRLAKKHYENEFGHEMDSETKAKIDSMEIVERMYKKRVYGSVLEAIDQSMTTFGALVRQMGMEDTDRTKLKKEMDTMSSTAMFDSYMHQRAAEYGMDVRALYSFFNGSPTADFIL